MLSRRNVAIGLAALALTLGLRRYEPLAHRGVLTDRALADDACALLNEEQVSAATEAKSVAGQHLVASSTKNCIWSEDPKPSLDHRRVTVDLITLQSFNMGRSSGALKTEPATGVGDDAYYIVFKGDAPSLVVRKGASAIQVRLLNGFKVKPLTIDEVKARELTLAKAAVGKL